jgi:hypothetical protein
MPPRGITFPVRKRRAVEHLEVKPPSDRITLKKMPASLVAKLDRPSAKGDHSNQLQDQEEKEHCGFFLASPLVVDGMHCNRQPFAVRANIWPCLRSHGHAREGAGNSLLALPESSTEAATWRVQATHYELHTPKLVRRQVQIHLDLLVPLL